MDFNKLWTHYDPKTYEQNKRCLSVNTILAGKYLVGPVLGQGGFGITYQGYDLNMETMIAIKEYFPVELVSRDTTTVHGDHVLSLSGEKSATYKQGLKKYVEEAQKVSQFSEIPGVVSVKDFFYENETAYIVMEYIEGESLKDYLKRKGGRLSEEETLFIMKPVIEALIKIHQAGIIHRDISPDNIMLTFDATKDNSEPDTIKSIKLIDFGASRMTAKNDQKSLTIILKHGYAPEEQYRTHGEQGAWTDVYAICATMYRMLSGETPVPAMDRMFQDNLKSIDLFGIKISKNTQNALLNGLAVKKDDRIQTMEELLKALYEGKAISAYRNTSRINTKIGLITSMMVVGIVAVCVVAYFAMNLTAPADYMQEVVDDNAIQEEAIEKITEEAIILETTDNESVEMLMEVEEEVIGETIAYPNPQTSISGLGDYVLLCLSDGTVKAFGSNDFGQCEVEEWHDVVAVSAGSMHALGLRSDGKVFAAGNDDSGQCAVDLWSDIIQIAAEGSISYGLTKEGTVVSTGQLYGFNFASGHLERVSEWKDIVAITTEGLNGGIFGLDQNGNILHEGETEWQEISGWNGVKHLICRSGRYLVGIKDDGSMLIAEQEDSGISPEVKAWTDVKQITSDLHLGVKLDGTVLKQEAFDYYSSKIDEINDELNKWTSLKAIWSSSNIDYIVGIKEDDTILEYKKNTGNSDLESMKNLAWIHALSGYNSSIFSETLVAATKDGKILTYGGYGEIFTDVINQNKFAADQIADVPGDGMFLLTDGRVYDCAKNTYVGEHVQQVINIYGSRYYCFIKESRELEFYISNPAFEDEFYRNYTMDIDLLTYVATNFDNNAKIKYSDELGLFIIHESGLVERRSETNTANKNGLEIVETWTDIQDLAFGETHVAGLKKDGTVMAMGSNHVGQCDVENWSDIVYIEAGSNYTLGITKNGDLKIAGSL